jgi:alpha-1,2-rhamnosyltransferase
VLQHDFIPLRYPELVSSESAAIFERWVADSLSRADFVLGVSETIADECRDELRKLGREDIAENRVRACLNGSDFKAVSSTTAMRPEILRFIDESSDGPYLPDGPYLTVGTIEPRKNQGMLADIFDDVFHAVPDVRFLIAGIVGWKGRAIVERIRKHPRYGKNILLVTDLSDAELTYAYQRAKAVVFPSLAEGFGLPIAESIVRGTPVFASQIAVHQEIGGAYCVYFDPRDSRSLTDLLVEYSKGGIFPAVWPPVNFRLPTWQESAEKVVATSLEMVHAQQSDRSESQNRKNHNAVKIST